MSPSAQLSEAANVKHQRQRRNWRPTYRMRKHRTKIFDSGLAIQFLVYRLVDCLEVMEISLLYLTTHDTDIMASPSPTVFARKYGPKNGTHRSGFTPLEYLFPRQIPDSEKQSIRDREDFQRRELCGFTTRELAQLDVISDRELKKGNLENCIHPLLARDRWENEPPQPSFTRDYLYPLHNENGLWSSDNPDVWRVLEPCLKLASRFLVSMHALPWVWHLLP